MADDSTLAPEAIDDAPDQPPPAPRRGSRRGKTTAAAPAGADAARPRRTSRRDAEPPALAAVVQPAPDAPATELAVAHAADLAAEVVPGQRRTRRRRSVARMPALVARADLPEDAVGRIELITVTPANAPAETGGADAVTELVTDPQIGGDVGSGSSRQEWLMLLGLGLVLVIVFVAGMAATH